MSIPNATPEQLASQARIEQRAAELLASREFDTTAILRLYAAMLIDSELELRRYKAAYRSARRRAQRQPIDLTAAIDRAARAHFDHGQALRLDAGKRRPDGQPWQWEDLTPIDQHAYRSFVLRIVTAALEATP